MVNFVGSFMQHLPPQWGKAWWATLLVALEAGLEFGSGSIWKYPGTTDSKDPPPMISLFIQTQPPGGPSTSHKLGNRFKVRGRGIDVSNLSTDID